jgi:DNA polymerase delta subunit 4
MSGKVTSFYKAQKAPPLPKPASKKPKAEPELPEVHGEAVGKDGELRALNVFAPMPSAAASAEPRPTRASSAAVDLTEDQRTLRSFDLTSKYGPCTGLSRLERCGPLRAAPSAPLSQGGSWLYRAACAWHRRCVAGVGERWRPSPPGRPTRPCSFCPPPPPRAGGSAPRSSGCSLPQW